ncbi:acyl-CoA dehydrogenase family protein [Streptomyces nigra]|uniref:acyl-CoA dehydrogenase family protein n=1 Tax=Streptomyces nigra TaxID=1827580 RepID=UPI0036CC11BF
MAQAALLTGVEEFIAEHVLPLDDEHDGDVEAAGGESLRARLQAGARERGLLSPHGPRDLGGLGLGMVERAPLFEAAGRSLFGPMALNVNAPDEGNIHLLDVVATAAQRERYLRPLVRGEVRSAFAMTEPAPGAGSDPSLLTTTATRVAGGWLINGRKWFITGADGAGFYIVMARTSGEPGDPGGATMMLAPADRTGIKVDRHIGTIDRSMLGGHCEVTFTDVVVPDDDVLGGVDEGFRYAQVRLGPARMTHVMRWTGAAQRAHEVAIRHVASRRAFDGRLADLGTCVRRPRRSDASDARWALIGPVLTAWRARTCTPLKPCVIGRAFGRLMQHRRRSVMPRQTRADEVGRARQTPPGPRAWNAVDACSAERTRGGAKPLR